MTMSDVRSYRDLLVWQNGIALVTDIYQATKQFPREEVYGLTSQMRRCAISIPSNIAEGHGHSTRKAYLRYLDIAVGSLYELQTQLIIARNLKILVSAEFVALESRSRELERMLSALIRSLRRKPRQ
jgi:four helix bundle protein